jgi:hypothetical protein
MSTTLHGIRTAPDKAFVSTVVAPVPLFLRDHLILPEFAS